MHLRGLSPIAVATLAVWGGVALADPPTAAALKDVTLVLRISKEFIRQHAPPPVEHVARIDRCLFGARVTGTAIPTGKPVVTMNEDHAESAFTLHFAGSTVTHTVATNGPVRAFTVGRAVFDVHREIRFSGTELSDGPETIECSYASMREGLAVPPGLRGRIVRRHTILQIEGNRPAADGIALADTKAEILARFAERTDKLMADLNANVPWKHTLVMLAPQDSDWVGGFSGTEERFEARSSHLHAPIPDLPDEAARLLAPIELWVLGQPDGAMAGKLVAIWGVSNTALNRFRDGGAASNATATAIAPTVVGDWWVIRVGADLVEGFLDGLSE